MGTAYNDDVVEWAKEQAELLRAGRFGELDILHIAEEIEDVGKSERRELASRMAVLLAHLMKWEWQSDRRGVSWLQTITVQRKGIERALTETPSLKASLTNRDWLEGVWGDAITSASGETGLADATFPDECPWTVDQIMDTAFLPGVALGANTPP